MLNISIKFIEESLLTAIAQNLFQMSGSYYSNYYNTSKQHIKFMYRFGWHFRRVNNKSFKNFDSNNCLPSLYLYFWESKFEPTMTRKIEFYPNHLMHENQVTMKIEGKHVSENAHSILVSQLLFFLLRNYCCCTSICNISAAVGFRLPIWILHFFFSWFILRKLRIGHKSVVDDWIISNSIETIFEQYLNLSNVNFEIIQQTFAYIHVNLGTAHINCEWKPIIRLVLKCQLWLNSLLYRIWADQDGWIDYIPCSFNSLNHVIQFIHFQSTDYFYLSPVEFVELKSVNISNVDICNLWWKINGSTECVDCIWPKTFNKFWKNHK